LERGEAQRMIAAFVFEDELDGFGAETAGAVVEECCGFGRFAGGGHRDGEISAHSWQLRLLEYIFIDARRGLWVQAAYQSAGSGFQRFLE